MTQCNVKKEIIPHGTRYIGKPGKGALISFVGTKERGNLIQALKPGLN
jgi:hypothetical protein